MRASDLVGCRYRLRQRRAHPETPELPDALIRHPQIAAARAEAHLAPDALGATPLRAPWLDAPDAPLRDALARACDDARAALHRRDALERQCVDALRDQGTGPTMTTYRRLIAAGCGGIPTEDVDAVVHTLGDLLDEGDGGAAAAQYVEQVRPRPARPAEDAAAPPVAVP